ASACCHAAKQKKQVEDRAAAAVARLEKAWDEYRANADYDRDAVYLYLQPVFDQVRQWKKEGVANAYSLIALKQLCGQGEGGPLCEANLLLLDKRRLKKGQSGQRS